VGGCRVSLSSDPQGGRQRFGRVPPHDQETEENLLGAALLQPASARVVAGLEPGHFYVPAHAHIADVVRAQVNEGSPHDAGTVAAILRQRGLLDAVGGTAHLIHLQSQVPVLSEAASAKWADMILAYAQRRRVLGITAELVEATYSGVSIAGLAAELSATADAQQAAAQSSWDPVNLAAVLAGEEPEAKPAWLRRDDGQALTYPARVHAANGEPEAGKSWFGALGVVEAARAGWDSLYVDFEDCAATLVERLLALGLGPAQILERVCYVRPEDPLDATARLRLRSLLAARSFAFAVVDGVAEALAQNAWDENKASDVTAFYEALPRTIARNGAAVLLVDHLVKEKEAQGRYARGSTAKLAGIDGATFKLEVVKPFGRGLHGLARVVLAKDRPGWVRKAAGGQRTVAELRLSSDEDGSTVTATLAVPEGATRDGLWRPTGYMERVSRALETAPEPLSKRGVLAVVHGKRDVILDALQALVAEGFVEPAGGSRGSLLHRSVRAFRENETPVAQHWSEPDEDF